VSDQEAIQKILVLQKEMKEDMRALHKDTAKVMRAVYGDPDNLVDGLIHRQFEDEKEIASLKDHKKKATWIIVGFTAALQAAWFWFREMVR
jgi:hypothetical protein